MRGVAHQRTTHARYSPNELSVNEIEPGKNGRFCVFLFACGAYKEGRRGGSVDERLYVFRIEGDETQRIEGPPGKADNEKRNRLNLENDDKEFETSNKLNSKIKQLLTWRLYLLEAFIQDRKS